MDYIKLPTLFAPAERASDTLLQQQIDYFTRNSTHTQTIAAIPEPLLILNQFRQTVDANQALLNFGHYKNRQEVLGQRPGEVFHCKNATLTTGGCGTTEFCRTCGAVKAILTSQHSKSDCQECCIIQSNSHKNLDLRVWATPFHTREGELFTLFVVSDISNEKRRHALERTFFHDVLNTIGVVQGYSQLLELNPDGHADYARQILRGSETIIEQIRAQQELSQAEAGDLNISPTTIDPVMLLREMATQYAVHETAHQKEIEVITQATHLEIESDTTLLGRVLGNMIKNALEATEPGGRVQLNCQPCEQGIEFSVHNSGLIPTVTQHHLFERSYSTKGRGRGLGTYSMQLLSERYLRGTVEFISTQQQGTTFYARFPLTLTH